MNEDFKKWLRREKCLQERSAGSVLSRCRRVERLLGITLDSIVHRPEAVDDVKEWLRREAPSYLQPDAIYWSSSIASLRQAVTLYVEYASLRS